jgi:hypothetical protein
MTVRERKVEQERTENMNTLADFKRRLVVGTKLRVTFLGGPLVVNGNVGQTVLPQKPPEDRVVAKVQSNAVAFSRSGVTDPLRLSWLYWPKAKDFTVEDGKAIISKDGKRLLQYEFLPEVTRDMTPDYEAAELRAYANGGPL